MIHIYKKGSNENTLLLLHGTGGNENDLLKIGNLIDPNANILSVRGNILENNMPRFFRRIKEGVFDIEDLNFRTHELYDFLNEMSKKYFFDRAKVIAIGYSNGANIAANMLFSIPNALYGAILLRPMVPRRNVKLFDLNNAKIFIGAGLYDNICPKEESIDLRDILVSANGNVHLEWVESSHRLTYEELQITRIWYDDNFIKKIS